MTNAAPMKVSRRIGDFFAMDDVRLTTEAAGLFMRHSPPGCGKSKKIADDPHEPSGGKEPS